MSIKDTNHGGGITYRIAECDCGERWELEERRARRLPPCTAVHGRGQPPTDANSGAPPPTSANPSASAEGVGGGLSSGPVLSGVSDPGPISPGNPNRARARRKPRADRTTYPIEFEAEWNQTAKTGSKDKACDAWERLGRPQFGASWKRWEASPPWQADWYNYPNVSSWLNDGRWKQDPGEARQKQPTPVNGSPKPTDPYCTFHHQPRTRGKLPPGGPAYGCPECKHAEAASGQRSGEPLALGGIR
jgi:hypothetical protein